MGTENMVEMRHIAKAYKKNVLFTDMNLELPKGDICGIVGENGSGKSVLLKMVCGLVLPDSGEIMVDGVKVEKGKFPQNIGVVLDCAGFLPGETGLKNLSIIAGIRKMVGKPELEAVMRMVGLNPEPEVKVGEYSLGMKQRLAIAQALMEKPTLMILDEPFNAIDRKTVGALRTLIRKLNREEGLTVLLTSHDREDIQELCQYTYHIEGKDLKRDTVTWTSI